MIPHTCKTCPLWKEAIPEPTDPDDERLGFCSWAVPLPSAWRYAPREVVTMYASEGDDCPVHPLRDTPRKY